MNLNENFISIQGILMVVEKNSGPLKKMKYRGGNENTILTLTIELHKFLSSKKYIKNDAINESFNGQLHEICLFLILNTEFKEPLDVPNLQHLINITPQLSTCLLANLIVGLNLCKHYCDALRQFDFTVVEQLLSEMIPCLKKCKMKVHVENSYEVLKLIVTSIPLSTDSVGSEKLTDIAAQILLNLTGLHGSQIENAQISVIHECMGWTLLNLLDLLLITKEKNQLVERLLQKLIKTCCSIMMGVTIDVFCSWAELERENEVLQTLISRKSYLFIEKYQKNPHAKELINMLGSIAQKPKCIKEQIFAADVPTMISMINKADINQKSWFVALLNTQVLMNRESVACVEKWACLCTVEDVSRLLNMSVTTTDEASKNVVVKCAATLSSEELVLVTTQYFHRNGITNNLSQNVNHQLILLFNKIKDKSSGDDFCRELYLLLLQNPELTLTYVITECSKNSFYSRILNTFWPSIKPIIKINDIGVNILKTEMATNKPCGQNCENYVQLFNALIEAHVFSVENIVLVIILPMLQNCGQDYELVKNLLEIVKGLNGTVVLQAETECLFNFLLDLMKTCRCNFLNFHGLKQEIVKLCVDIFERHSDMNRTERLQSPGIKSEDFFVSFYRDQIFEQDFKPNILMHFFPISFENHAETVAHLIKVLPLCVTTEWVILTTNLADFCGFEKTIELLCDFMILLCELVNCQESKTEEVKCMFHGLAYCLQNLGVVIKECLQPRIKSANEDVALTRNVCRLLREIPNGNLKSGEGLSLASLLSNSSLQSLRSDKKFASLVASIHESHICKMLAQKILS